MTALPKKRLPIGTIILTGLFLLTLPAFIIRFLNGIGSISNLSDGRGWGLWISFDLYCGVALAAGGFTLAAIYYIFGREKYHAVVRPAILTAFLGYLLVILALLVDLGQPWYIWHIVVSPNIHSPLFEVGVCVISYTAVLALEFSPAVFERLGWHIPWRIIRAIQIPIVILGIALSTLHQSSLGSMLLVMPVTMDPIWYTPILPILFFISAVSVGPAMVIFEATLSSKAFGHNLDIGIVSGLGKYLRYILAFYLVVKVADLIIRGDAGLVFTGYPQNLLWWAEVIIGIILPAILFSLPSVHQSRKKMFWSATLVVLGLALNRFNVSMLALAMRPGTFYFPSLLELAISVGLIVDGLLIIKLANHLLPISHHQHEESPEGVAVQVTPDAS